MSIKDFLDFMFLMSVILFCCTLVDLIKFLTF